MIVRIVRQTKSGWMAGYYNTPSIEAAQAFADKKYKKSAHYIQYDITQQDRLGRVADMFETIKEDKHNA